MAVRSLHLISNQQSLAAINKYRADLRNPGSSEIIPDGWKREPESGLTFELRVVAFASTAPSPANTEHLHRQSMFIAKGEPPALIVLKPITWAFDFDHSIATPTCVELNEIRQTRAVLPKILEQACKIELEVRRGNRAQRVFKQIAA